MDRIIPALEEDAFPLARRLASEEGLSSVCPAVRLRGRRSKSRASWVKGHRVAMDLAGLGSRYSDGALFRRPDIHRRSPNEVYLAPHVPSRWL